MIKISDAELEVMQVFWGKKEANSFDVIEALKDKNWSDNTVRTLIKRLQAKKAITIVKQEGKVYYYKSLINENEYIIYNEPVEGIYKDFWNWFGSIRIKEFNENILLIKDIENTYCRIYGKSSITFLDKNAKEQFKIENIISNALFVDEPDRYAYINLPIQVNQDSIIYYRENEDKEIDVEKIKLLNIAINETKVKIVLTSSWRYTRNAQELRKLLSEYGISTDSTPFIQNERGLEIKQYLYEHPDVEDFVIVDDEIFDSYNDELVKKLVKISNGNGHNFGEGLLPKDIDEIIENLDESLKVENRFIAENLPGEVHVINIINKSASKGNAILGLCKYLKIKPEEAMAFGDDYNDISMMNAVYGVAMGNAFDDIKSLSKEVLRTTNNEAGIAEVLNRIVEERKDI